MSVNELALPEPATVALGELRTVIVPRAEKMRQQIAVRADVPAARELCRQLEAFRRYLQDREGRDLLAAECRRTEILIGKLLGPGKPGPPTESSPAGEDSKVSRNDRHKFRLLAAHEAQVEAMLAEGKVARNQILEELQRPRTNGTPELPTAVYRCIVADPPWPMKRSERSPRPEQGPELPYETMGLDAIEALPVVCLANPEGCHLYLWVTHRFLREALAILTAWGFSYHCLLTWVKPTGMTPFSWMFNTEHVLFGYRGKFACERMGLKVSFEAPAPRGGHSTKPEVFYERVREFSDGPRLEMFARTEREGFHAWGNELAG